MSETERSYVKAGLVVASDIQTHRVERGIVICGTGIGISVRATRRHPLRTTSMSLWRDGRQHNDVGFSHWAHVY